MDNHCVMCGAYLADTGRMVCEKCEKQQTELKPCPFCGGKDIWYVLEYDLVYAKCQVCGATGSKYRTMVVAKEAWNRRAENEELKFTRQFIHEHGLDFELASAWNRRAEDGK